MFMSPSVSPMSPYVPLRVPPCPVSPSLCPLHAPVSPSLCPSLCPSMSPGDSMSMDSESLSVPRPRCRPSLHDPPPPCCLPPDASTRWGRSVGSSSLGCGPSPTLAPPAAAETVLIVRSLLTGRHLTGGQAAPEATQPVGASRAQVPHQRAVWTQAPCPGCGHVRPSVRSALLGVCHCFLSSRLHLYAVPGVLEESGWCARTPCLLHAAWKCPRPGWDCWGLPQSLSWHRVEPPGWEPGGRLLRA